MVTTAGRYLNIIFVASSTIEIYKQQTRFMHDGNTEDYVYVMRVTLVARRYKFYLSPWGTKILRD